MKESKKKVLIIAEKNQLGTLAKWIKQETKMKTKRFNIYKGFPSVEGITHIFLLIPGTIKKKSPEFLLFTNPHIEKDFFYDKKVFIEFNIKNKKIEKLEGGLRPIFRSLKTY